MPYGIIKVDQVTFTNAGVDQTISVSGIVASISGNITATGTISGNVIRGGTTVSGATVTGTAGQFGTITGNTAGFTTVTGTTVTGTTATFTSGVFTNISGGTHTITSGVFASGTAANPSITFQGDVNTGIYSPGADQVAISTNGTNRFQIDSSGNIIVDTNTFYVDATNNRVGVGTTSPGYLVTAATSADGVDGVSVESPSVNGVIRFRADGTNGNAIRVGGVGAQGNTLRFLVGGDVERMRLDSSGRLGVGTSSPSAKLDVEASNFAGGPAIGARYNTSNVRLGFNVANSNGFTYIGSNTNNKLSSDTATYDLTGQPASQLRLDGGQLIFNNAPIGTAGNDITFTNRLTITSAGLVGIGTSSPSYLLDASGSGSIGIRYKSTGAYGTIVSDNSSATGGGLFIAQQNGSTKASFGASGGIEGNTSSDAALFAETGGAIRFYTNGSATAKAILDSTGRLGIGTIAASAKLHVFGAGSSSNTLPGNASAVFETDANVVVAISTPSANTASLVFPRSTDAYYAGIERSGTDLNLRNNGSTRATIDSSGRLLVGTSSARSNFYNSSDHTFIQLEGVTNPDSSFSIVQNYNANTNGPSLVFGKNNSQTKGTNVLVASGDRLGRVSFQGNDGAEFVAAADITADVDGTPGANDMPGRLVFSTTPDNDPTGPKERMRIGNDGWLYVGTTSRTLYAAAGSTTGLTFGPGELGVASSGTNVLYLNRTVNDGELVGFFQDGTKEGTISVSGTTVSYNGAHLSRWSQLPSGQERTEILRGTVLSNIDEMCEWGEEENEQLNRMKVSDVEGDKNVAGVFQAWDDDDDTYTNDFYCAMTGDFIIRIAEGVTVERGDLLMSAGDGTAKPQDDDIIRSKTIAKVTSTNVSCTYDDGSYCVPCVLMAC